MAQLRLVKRHTKGSAYGSEITQITLPVVTTGSGHELGGVFLATRGGSAPAAVAFRGQPREYQTLAPSFQRLFSGDPIQQQS